MEKIKSWIKNHKLEVGILFGMLLLGAFMRLYRIDGYLTFLGDEGRDVIIVRRIFTELHPPLIGPGTSIGNMYLGPLYYYLMAIPLLVANFNPVGPALFIALLGVGTIFFVWWVVREFFPTEKENWGALVAAFLYAISPVIIIYSRSSWNPNIMPFFSLVCIYGMWRVMIKQQIKWLVVVAISFAFVMQSHYLGLLLVPTLGILWIIGVMKTGSKRKFIFYSIFGLGVFLALMSPLVIFDMRHGGNNFEAIKKFFTERETTVAVKPWKAVPAMWPILNLVTTDLVAAKNGVLGGLMTGILGGAFLFVAFFKREKFDEKKMVTMVVIALWVGFGLLGLGLYKQHIYDHYFGFFFTAPFIILGGILGKVLKDKRRIFTIAGGLLVLVLLVTNILDSPLRSAPNKQLERAQVVAGRVDEISQGEKFNFALIADNNYDSAYRYFLNLRETKVTDIDPLNTKETITEQLIVVCERVKEKCDPTHNPKAEVANFGWSKISEEYDNIFGVTIYKLSHTK